MPAESNGTVERSYTMLEERTIADILRASVDDPVTMTAAELIAHFEKAIVYEELGALEARNADHAYRLTHKARFGDDDGEMRVAAISSKTWKVRTVRPKVRRSLTVG
jgi:hypothetical protein